MSAVVLRGDARSLPLPDGSVDLIVTSPPYWSLRDYRDGGESLAGQIGSEATPQEYIANLLDCTREWMRVLKPAGSLFVNLGDAFSSGHRFDKEFTVEDAAWLAGVVDSDGAISIHKQGNSYSAWVRVGQMRPEVVRRIHDVTGLGTVCEDKRGCWHWQAAAQQASAILSRIWPWLHIKQRQALAGVELQSRKAAVGGKGRWNPLSEEELGHRERIRRAVVSWNAGTPDDYNPPLLPLPDLPMQARWIPAKSLIGLPWRYALACADELGLYLRSEIVWQKPNGLPESVTDRVRRAHEQIFHFTMQSRYYSAVDEVREEYAPGTAKRYAAGYNSRKVDGARTSVNTNLGGDTYGENPLGKLPGSVWDIPSQPLTVPASLGIDHFAAFPMELPRRIILGWSPPGICTACGEGRRPITAAGEHQQAGHGGTEVGDGRRNVNGWASSQSTLRTIAHRTITGYACSCPTPAAPTRPAVILDPFSGTGTTSLVADMLGRDGISVDRSADYCRLARWRTTDPAERARALGVPKPPPVIPGQLDLLTGEAS